mmetsp:Transcript_21829/g.62197  ORF Transcript_21829/g.62197 Transcript_21829/m.62197 type:complete len:410 (+) Transcript_21829:297-1526(+)|eukprot:CAMPEP_0119562804 /NCGR_PEP_ID=MMETSP1352-20130426/21612_1 /TAXON_ID=265584 /ORGANISM="Stauroneis constricta, Strain CCMP1120" /LENGTH=409 /DNA_ID=CAMNT_0007611293 /DNA_START=217 /DNA_END=1446 /DNA_ORIENTATION=+
MMKMERSLVAIALGLALGTTTGSVDAFVVGSRPLLRHHLAQMTPGVRMSSHSDRANNNQGKNRESRRNVRKRNDERTVLSDDMNDASPLFLSDSDKMRFADLQQRAMTIPIVILPDSILLPGQTLPLDLGPSSMHPSQLQTFRQILNYVDDDATDSNEIGILGINPQTQLPMNTGVTARVHNLNDFSGSSSSILTASASPILHLEGHRQFHVLDQPFMDDSGSFHLANIELFPSSTAASSAPSTSTTGRSRYASDGQFNHASSRFFDGQTSDKAQAYHQQIPILVKEWYQVLRQRFHHMQQRKQNDRNDIPFRQYQQQLLNLQQSVGPMPITWKERAFWVASMLHPTPNLQLPSLKQQQQQHHRDHPFSYVTNVSRIDIRPAMLTCRTDAERLLLATTALQSSIQYMVE